MSTTQIAQHTPGPWNASNERTAGGYPVRAESIKTGSVGQTEREYYSTLTVATERSAHPIHGGGIADGEARANARLIAAAPDLLSALREMLIANHGLPINPDDESDPVCRNAIIAARAAIAKATEDAR